MTDTIVAGGRTHSVDPLLAVLFAASADLKAFVMGPTPSAREEAVFKIPGVTVDVSRSADEIEICVGLRGGLEITFDFDRSDDEEPVGSRFLLSYSGYSENIAAGLYAKQKLSLGEMVKLPKILRPFANLVGTCCETHFERSDECFEVWVTVSDPDLVQMALAA